MTDTPRMVIVPADLTDEMSLALTDAEAEGTSLAALNSGKISRADLERAMEAADHAHSRQPGTPNQRDRIWQDAFAAALGLEIAE